MHPIKMTMKVVLGTMAFTTTTITYGDVYPGMQAVPALLHMTSTVTVTAEVTALVRAGFASRHTAVTTVLAYGATTTFLVPNNEFKAGVPQQQGPQLIGQASMKFSAECTDVYTSVLLHVIDTTMDVEQRYACTNYDYDTPIIKDECMLTALAPIPAFANSLLQLKLLNTSKAMVVSKAEAYTYRRLSRCCHTFRS
jgi:hypothetical protein